MVLHQDRFADKYLPQFGFIACQGNVRPVQRFVETDAAGSQLAYADRNKSEIFFARGSVINMCFEDGWFYFKSSSTLYGTKKGAEPVEILHCSGTSKATNDDYCRYGLILYGNDRNYYLIKNGTATQIQSEP